jgi:hypothetical protein
VTEIEEKKNFHLLKVRETLGLDSLDGIQTSTVKEVSGFLEIWRFILNW